VRTPRAHTYFRRSTSEPGGTYTVGAEVTYTVTWTARGPGLQVDDDPLDAITGEGSYDLVVHDAQAVIP
jgi:hypothetical protein